MNYGDEAYNEARLGRIAAGSPLKAPPCCRHCKDERDCDEVLVCRSIEEELGRPVD